MFRIHSLYYQGEREGVGECLEDWGEIFFISNAVLKYCNVGGGIEDARQSAEKRLRRRNVFIVR